MIISGDEDTDSIRILLPKNKLVATPRLAGYLAGNAILRDLPVNCDDDGDILNIDSSRFCSSVLVF